ncbi:PIN domain-containing protein [Natroniella acetigena]|uniref:PIN domain-containing protein n=1 Tax=Natroniella acetigena TaxID=52004 RepID=UPI00200A612C|nr:PIN domain-containing protein [Natroniella acetigena]MCK8827696.1 PIN domain-containing protein [Natroniella acetigena]
MKKVVIDINVIMDLALKREGFKAAEKAVDYCARKKVEGYVCSHEITTLAYLLERNFGKKRVKYFLQEILDIFEVLPSTGQTLRSALDSPINDYEDAVIEVSALEAEIDSIVTRNLKDFKNSRVRSLSPEEFIVKQL